MSTTATPKPPSYSLTMSSELGECTGFPPTGYFVVRSLATGRLLDVSQSSHHDGAELILWPETETSLVETFRSPSGDNQVFFIDTSGYLCSKHSGHAVDADANGRLVLRHRKPVIIPYPNACSHPLPYFAFESSTGQITVEFKFDPAYPPLHPDPDVVPSTAWREKKYLLCAIPVKRERSIIDEAADFLVSSPLFSWAGPSTTATATEVSRGDFDLREDELLEEDRADSGYDQLDDSPDPLRPVRVLGFKSDQLPTTTGRQRSPAARRRMWEIIPLRRTNKATLSPR